MFDWWGTMINLSRHRNPIFLPSECSGNINFEQGSTRKVQLYHQRVYKINDMHTFWKSTFFFGKWQRMSSQCLYGKNVSTSCSLCFPISEIIWLEDKNICVFFKFTGVLKNILLRRYFGQAITLSRLGNYLQLCWIL